MWQNVYETMKHYKSMFSKHLCDADTKACNLCTVSVTVNNFKL